MKNKPTGLVSIIGGSAGEGGDSGPAEWELRPGGMLVQKRSPDSDRNSLPAATIRVRVKFGSIYHEICISSQATFGNPHDYYHCYYLYNFVACWRMIGLELVKEFSFLFLFFFSFCS